MALAVDRAHVEDVLEKLRERMDRGDFDAWIDLFSENCTFRNSAMRNPVVGREALRAMASLWPKVDNRLEWYAIDEHRLVVCWNEEQESMSDAAPRYRGISTFVFEENGMICEYEGMFDTAAVAAAVGRPVSKGHAQHRE